MWPKTTLFNPTNYFIHFDFSSRFREDTEDNRTAAEGEYNKSAGVSTSSSHLNTNPSSFILTVIPGEAIPGAIAMSTETIDYRSFSTKAVRWRNTRLRQPSAQDAGEALQDLSMNSIQHTMDTAALSKTTSMTEVKAWSAEVPWIFCLWTFVIGERGKIKTTHA